MRPLFRYLALLLPHALSLPAAAQYVSDWNPDADGDNAIGVNDLLALLSVYEEADSDNDGVYNSQSSLYAADWNPDADGDNSITVNDLLGFLSVFEETDSDNDGIFDSQDDCVGTIDVCGVCNGPGPTVLIEGSLICPVYGCTDPAAFNFSATANSDDGTCAYGPAQCGGQSTVTFDGHTYALVGIGTQCWFKENLRSDNYRNGDAVPGNLTDSQWTSTGSGAQSVYGEGASTVYHGSSDEVANLAAYGRLYNWYAVNDARGLCPVGFHVPSNGEWAVLENALGGWITAGTALKSSGADSPPWNGTNSSGFSGLPGGLRQDLHGSFYNSENSGYWWSSSTSGLNAWYRLAGTGGSVLGTSFGSFRNGLSVRCVRDEGVICLDPDNDGICAESEVSGCTNTYATNFNSAATEEDGSCVLPGPAECSGASTVTFDGHTYALVSIGSLCWFKENLRSDNYLNGDPIPGNLTNSQWTSTGSGAQAVYNNNPANLATYGRLYNWYAVNDVRGLCPVGFHVPSDTEWMDLEMALGMTSALANSADWRGTDQGSRLKASSSESPPWNGSNTSGFSALPGGRQADSNGFFYGLGGNGYWWSSSPSGSYAWTRGLSGGNSSVGRYSSDVRSGYSVRCVRD